MTPRDDQPPWDDEPVPIHKVGRFAVLLGTISTDPPPPMLVGRLDPEGHTILYGPGGVGKGALTCWWIVRLVTDGHRVLILDWEGHATEWARRIRSLDASALAGVW